MGYTYVLKYDGQHELTFNFFSFIAEFKRVTRLEVKPSDEPNCYLSGRIKTTKLLDKGLVAKVNSLPGVTLELVSGQK